MGPGTKGSLKREVRGIFVRAGLEICRRCLGLFVEGVQGRDALFGSQRFFEERGSGHFGWGRFGDMPPVFGPFHRERCCDRGGSGEGCSFWVSLQLSSDLVSGIVHRFLP